jgi:phospholipase C
MRSTFLSVLGVFAGVLSVHAQPRLGPGPQTSHFKHIVVIFQENRTPDNLFYGLCSAPYGLPFACSTTPNAWQYNIQTDHWANLNSASGYTNPTPIPLANAYDLDHSHTAFKNMCNVDPTTGECKMNGAINIGCSGTCPSQPQYKYVDNSQGVISPYLDLATQYGWANYMFQTNQGPSFPAHQFIFGGTSAPSATDDADGIFAAENMSNTGIAGLNAVAGCIAPTTTTVQLIDSAGVEDPSRRIYPCFEHRTLPDVLPPNVTWRYYAPGAGTIWTAPDAIQHICQSSGPGGICQGPLWQNNVDLKPADVLTDIANCNLRNLSWIIPTGVNSDHARSTDGGGPSWVASIVNAIGNSSTCDGDTGYWQNTAIILTWDDWGGWYDHVAPTILPYPQGAYQLGFRVPLIVISAHTPRHYINNYRHDFGSILRFIEANFSVPEGELNFADARADNELQLFFDYSRAPRPFQTIGAPLTGSFFINDKRPATDPDDQ